VLGQFASLGMAEPHPISDPQVMGRCESAAAPG
jgi:hypothetical protein